MYKNVINPGKSVSFVLKDIDIGGQTSTLYVQVLSNQNFPLAFHKRIREEYLPLNLNNFNILAKTFVNTMAPPNIPSIKDVRLFMVRLRMVFVLLKIHG